MAYKFGYPSGHALFEYLKANPHYAQYVQDLVGTGRHIVARAYDVPIQAHLLERYGFSTDPAKTITFQGTMAGLESERFMNSSLGRKTVVRDVNGALRFKGRAFDPRARTDTVHGRWLAKTRFGKTQMAQKYLNERVTLSRLTPRKAIAWGVAGLSGAADILKLKGAGQEPVSWEGYQFGRPDIRPDDTYATIYNIGMEGMVATGGKIVESRLAKRRVAKTKGGMPTRYNKILGRRRKGTQKHK